jgi:hypothetical protein
MTGQHLQSMYQQWQQDNDQFIEDWLTFVELAAREYRTNEDIIIRELQKYSWFRWPNE